MNYTTVFAQRLFVKPGDPGSLEHMADSANRAAAKRMPRFIRKIRRFCRDLIDIAPRDTYFSLYPLKTYSP